MRPTEEVFSKAVRAAYRKIGFVATAVHTWSAPFLPGEVKTDLYNFPIRIKVVRKITRHEWLRFFNALNEALPEGNKSNGMESGRFRYYEVKVLRK